MERGRMQDVMDSIEGLGNFDKNVQRSSYQLPGAAAFSGNRYSIQHIEASGEEGQNVGNLNSSASAATSNFRRRKLNHN